MSRNYGSGILVSIAVSDTGGGTGGVDFEITCVARDSGVTHTLSVTSASTTYDQYVDMTPTGLTLQIVNRSPVSTSVAVDAMQIRVSQQPTTTLAQQREDTMAIRILRNGATGAYTVQGAPPPQPPLEGQLVAVSAQSTVPINSSYTGTTQFPTANQRFLGVVFEAGRTPPGSVLYCDAWIRPVVAGSSAIGMWGVNTAGGSTPVQFAEASRGNNISAPHTQTSLVLHSSTQRSSWVDVANSGNGGTGGLRPMPNANLNTNESWALFLTRNSGAGTWVCISFTLRLVAMSGETGVFLT